MPDYRADRKHFVDRHEVLEVDSHTQVKDVFRQLSNRPRAGIIVVPGAPFFADRPEGHHARMSYSGVPDERLVAGVRAMGELLREALA